MYNVIRTFFKNLLEIPNGEPSNTTLAFLYDLHDDILLRFGEEHIIETISLLCAFISAEKSSSLNFLLLEIMALLFKLEEPEKLLAPTSGANSAAALRLQAALNEKKASAPVRHSKFGGTYIVPRMVCLYIFQMLYVRVGRLKLLHMLEFQIMYYPMKMLMVNLGDQR